MMFPFVDNEEDEKEEKFYIFHGNMESILKPASFPER